MKTTRQTGPTWLPKIAGAASSVAMLAVIISACSAGDVTTASYPEVTEAPSAATTEKPTPKPAASKPSAPKPKSTVRQPTRGERNALDSAQSYVDISAYSKKGLTRQVKYEGYSKSEVAYAIAHVDVDYMDEAVESAESYLDISSYSKKRLLEQLKFEGFTDKQAQHGVDEAY